MTICYHMIAHNVWSCDCQDSVRSLNKVALVDGHESFGLLSTNSENVSVIFLLGEWMEDLKVQYNFSLVNFLIHFSISLNTYYTPEKFCQIHSLSTIHNVRAWGTI